jgi:HSP20 family molecular chaperone IbpA
MFNSLSINPNSSSLYYKGKVYNIKCGPVWEEDEKGNYKLTLEVPGIGKENASFTIKDSILRFEGGYEDREYKQEYSIPEEADASKCKVVLKNGIAKVTLPKLESQKARQIDID